MDLRIFKGSEMEQDDIGTDRANVRPTEAEPATKFAERQFRSIAFVQTCTVALDLFLTVVGLLLLMPVFLVIAVAIRVDTPGSVLFKQKRVGQDGREFWFYKFRSMVVDAEAMRAALLQMNEASGPLFKMKQDPRITRIGRILRKYSLDELPQLINVIKGDMSLVGPRPALPVEVAQYQSEQLRRLEVRPGITGLWQVSGRSDLSFERSIELDIEFIEGQSIGLYVIILLKTLPAVLLGRGAY
jgi:lipopolysaccharide/colanic/teichoic acid biosynthesis glycosyltransferase